MAPNIYWTCVRQTPVFNSQYYQVPKVSIIYRFDCTCICMSLAHLKIEYSSVFRENRCPPPPKPVYGGNFIHEAVTLKIRSRSPKSNKLLILSDLYRLANLVNLMVPEIKVTKFKSYSAFYHVQMLYPCKSGQNPPAGSWDIVHTSTFWLKFGSLVPHWPWKIGHGHQNQISPNVISLQIWLKSANQFMRYGAHKHFWT